MYHMHHTMYVYHLISQHTIFMGEKTLLYCEYVTDKGTWPVHPPCSIHDKQQSQLISNNLS